MPDKFVNATDKVVDDGKLELSENQQNPYLARPEDFKVRQNDETHDSVSGQTEDGPVAAAKSNTRFNRGSQKKQANVKQSVSSKTPKSNRK